MFLATSKDTRSNPANRAQRIERIEQMLIEDNVWLAGNEPSKQDADEFEALGEGAILDVEKNPKAFAWYILVSRFTKAVRDQWKKVHR